MRPPKLDQKVVDALTDAQLKALIAACAGKRFTDIRDPAIIRFMADTRRRADEVIPLKVIDIQIAAGSAVIIRGKGGKGRRVGFGRRLPRPSPGTPGPGAAILSPGVPNSGSPTGAAS